MRSLVATIAAVGLALTATSAGALTADREVADSPAVAVRFLPDTMLATIGGLGRTRLRMRNDDTRPVRLLVEGCRPPQGVRLVVRDRGDDVSDAVSRGRWRSPLVEPGTGIALRVTARIGPSARPSRSTCRFVVRVGGSDERAVARFRLTVRDSRP